MDHDQRAVARELADLPGLDGLGRGDLHALAEAGRAVSLPDGWAFVQEGTPADAAYILLEGEANVLSGRSVIASLSPGAIIGEMAYLDGGQRHATVASHGRVRALRLDYEALSKLVGKRPALAEVLSEVDRAHRGAKSD